MTIDDIRTRAGSLWSYGGYLFLLFCYYFAFHRLEALVAENPENPLLSLLDWGIRILIAPLVLAGVFGGIYGQQRARDEEWSFGAFLKAALTHYGRMLGANLLGILAVLVLWTVVSTAAGVEEPPASEEGLWMALLTVPYAALSLFWYAGVVVERRIFRGLLHALRTLVFNPLALAVGIAWGLASFADNVGLQYLGQPPSLALDGLRAAVLAVARILAVAYALSIYRQGRDETVDRPAEEASSTSSGEGWIKAGFGLAFVSFLPLVHLAALAVGIAAFRRAGRFSLRAAIAVCTGAFFTLLYLLMLAGWLTGGPVRAAAPAYTFLSDANTRLEPQVALLEQGSYLDVQQQLERTVNFTPARHWTFDTALALAKVQAYDLEGALEDFRTAAEQAPERSEFYYYYGVVLLNSGRPEMAAEQFRTALEHEPRLEVAQSYVDLIESTYNPSREMLALLFVVILLVSFTLHEYGHAYAAWKLGDDTAQKQGRLTLNPIPHLELFGSIVLPGILLLQNAGIVFGWAKPVPVDPANFKDPRRDHMRVSFAGPAMNFLVAMASFLLLGGTMLAVRLFWPGSLSLGLAAPFSAVSVVGPPFAHWLVLGVVFLKHLFYTSLVLGIFNLIPVPPLDGSWILAGLLPQGLRAPFERIRPYGFLIFLLLVVTSATDYILGLPVSLAWGALDLVLSAMAFG